jgi:class 3 adenylate cyclase
VRASDVDRNAVVERLSKATGEGRITLEEFADAAGAAYAAVTLAELDSLYRSFGLVDALPPPPMTSPSVAQPVSPSTAAEPAPVDNVVAIMSSSNRKGRWRVRPRTRAFAFWGGVKLDLRDAVIESDVVEIEAWAVMGGVDIIVPEGIPVEMTGCVIMGGRNARVADVPLLPGAPVVRVAARGMWGGVDVRSRKSRNRQRSGEAVAVTGAPVTGVATVLDGGAIGGDVSARTDRFSHADHDHLRHRDRGRGRSSTGRDRRNEGPPPGPTPQSGDLLTVVCTDIVGSTRLSVALGDQRWHSVLSAHNSLVRELLARFGGTEVKTSGDGFLLTFTSARAALQFSMALHDAMTEERETRPDARIELRIGVHAGEVERDGRDVIGRNVTIACRLCDAAAPGEVLASAVVADLADSASDLTFGPSREHSLPGIDRPLVARPATRS